MPQDWIALTPTSHQFAPAGSGDDFSHSFVNSQLAAVVACKLEDLDGDRWLDFVGSGPQGLLISRGTGEDREAIRLRDGAVRLVRTIDLHDEGDTLDIVFCEGNALVLLEQEDDGSYAESPVALPTLPSPPADLRWSGRFGPRPGFSRD